MLGIKKQFIKNKLQMEVVASKEGKLILLCVELRKIKEEQKKYAHYIAELIKRLRGITQIQVNYEKALIAISYDSQVVKARQIQEWINQLIDLGIELYDRYKKDYDKKDFEEPNCEHTIQEIIKKCQPEILKLAQTIK